MTFDPSTFFGGGMDKPDEGNWKPPPLPMMMPWLPDCESSDIETKGAGGGLCAISTLH